MISFCFTIFGCATDPRPPYVPPKITINTIPSGADISIQGSYIGKSPIAISIPGGTWGRGERGYSDSPIQIEAQLTGYETKTVSFGEFHAPEDKVIQPIFSYSATTKTEPGYYTFSNQITIKLSPK